MRLSARGFVLRAPRVFVVCSSSLVAPGGVCEGVARHGWPTDGDMYDQTESERKAHADRTICSDSVDYDIWGIPRVPPRCELEAFAAS